MPTDSCQTTRLAAHDSVLPTRPGPFAIHPVKGKKPYDPGRLPSCTAPCEPSLTSRALMPLLLRFGVGLTHPFTWLWSVAASTAAPTFYQARSRFPVLPCSATRNTTKDASDRLLPRILSRSSTLTSSALERSGACAPDARGIGWYTPPDSLRRVAPGKLKGVIFPLPTELGGGSVSSPPRHPCDRTSDAPVALFFDGALSLSREPDVQTGPRSIPPYVREERTAFPIRSAFHRRVPFSGLHRSRDFAAACRITTPIRPAWVRLRRPRQTRPRSHRPT